MTADRNDSHYVYSSPSIEDFKAFSNWIDVLLTEFAEYSGISRDSILTNKALLVEIHNRVDQRRSYYLSYHSDKERATIMT